MSRDFVWFAHSLADIVLYGFNQDEILNSRNELSGAGGVDR